MFPGQFEDSFEVRGLVKVVRIDIVRFRVFGCVWTNECPDGDIEISNLDAKLCIIVFKFKIIILKNGMMFICLIILCNVPLQWKILNMQNG